MFYLSYHGFELMGQLYVPLQMYSMYSCVFVCVCAHTYVCACVCVELVTRRFVCHIKATYYDHAYIMVEYLDKSDVYYYSNI